MRSCAYALAAALAVAFAVPGTPATAHAAAVGSVAVRHLAAAAVPVTVARYGFDGSRAGTVLDESGRGHTLRLVSANGGALRTVPHTPAMGVQFPVKCVVGRNCPRAVLQTPHRADLNPGTRRISYGATVRLAPGQTTKGQNVLQKGYSATTSQYKLQIDGGAGLPSCVLVGTRTGIRLVRSTVSVADGRWHTVACHRVGTLFRILVDGAVRGLARIPASLSVRNNRPLSIGGKGVYPDNDQFQGALDDIYVRIG